VYYFCIVMSEMKTSVFFMVQESRYLKEKKIVISWCLEFCTSIGRNDIVCLRLGSSVDCIESYAIAFLVRRV
jgi:hypothetical protein